MPPPDQNLPQKEAAQFKQILKLYESKQYKKALKMADGILKKFPEHGETLAMKGLTLNCLDKKEEAQQLVRLGLRYNMKSHVCWHVFGLMYRAEHDYKEAIKCYLQALKRDENNHQILRDLSLLQIQTRDLSGFKETRRTLLHAGSKNRNNWISFAVANHLLGNCEEAIKVLEAYEGTLEELAKPEYEHSEMLLYKADLLRLLGKDDDALKHLDKSEPNVLDKLSLKQDKARLLIKLGRGTEALPVFEALIDSNPENLGYYRGILESMGHAVGGADLSAEAQDSLTAKCAQIRAKFPRCAAALRFPLDYLAGDRFVAYLDEYVRKWLRKGVPSLFNDLKSLYSSPAKAEAIDALFNGYLTELRKSQKFTIPMYGDKASEGEECPAVLLWTLYFWAQHRATRGDTAAALEAIDEAITHTPTVIDPLLIKAKIYGGVGGYSQRSNLCEEARHMDLADRYLNTVSVAAALRADRLETAEAVVTLFTKDGDNPNNLFDMQAMWYEIKYGKSCLRQQLWGRALKKFKAVEKHFNDIAEDQFDFHSYCVRKMTIRTYLALLGLEDRIYGHRYFVRAALGCIQAYVALHDKPPLTKEQEEEAELAGLSESERKKVLSKRRRAEARTAQEKEKAEASKKEADKSKPRGKKKDVDEDPYGEQLAKVANPLDQAVTFLHRLNKYASDKLEVQVAAVEVWLRKGRALRVLQAVKRAMRISPDSPEAKYCLGLLLHMVDSRRAELGQAAAQVIDEELKAESMAALAKDGAAALARTLLTDAGASMDGRFAAARLLAAVGGDAGKKEAMSVLLDPAADLSNRKLLHRVLQWVTSVDTEAASAFATRAASVHAFDETFDPTRKVELPEHRPAAGPPTGNPPPAAIARSEIHKTKK